MSTQATQPFFWTNRDNKAFYSSIGVAGLQRRAVECGLTEHPDLKCLLSYLRREWALPEAPRMMEIGAGYGRVAEGMLLEFPKSHLTLVELSPPSATFLRARYKYDTRVSLIEGSLLEVKLPRALDLALWMWAGFLDFTLSEKSKALTKVARSLNPGARIAVEIPRTVGTEVRRDGGNIVLDMAETRYHGHLPGKAELIALSRTAGLELEKELFYETKTGLKRTIYLFRKQP